MIDFLKNIRIIRSIVYFFVGLFTYPLLNMYNKLSISGTEHIQKLPKKNVLFISNHQTYFAEVIAFLHIFCAIKWRKRNKLGIPYYLLNPFAGVYFVSAAETMKKSSMTRLFELAGAINVKRTWSDNSNEVRHGLDPSDTRKIERILSNNWVINFPQGTTTAFAKGRKGSVILIKKNKPVVIPIVIKGFDKAFSKKRLTPLNKGTKLEVTFKPPLEIDYNMTNDEILAVLMDAIEQSESFRNDH